MALSWRTLLMKKGRSANSHSLLPASSHPLPPMTEDEEEQWKRRKKTCREVSPTTEEDEEQRKWRRKTRRSPMTEDSEEHRKRRKQKKLKKEKCHEDAPIKKTRRSNRSDRRQYPAARGRPLLKTQSHSGQSYGAAHRPPRRHPRSRIQIDGQ